MLQRGLSRLVTAVALCLALNSANAGVPAQPLPPNVAVHVSIESPVELLAALDAYVSDSTRDSRYQLPPGMLYMIAMNQLPFPLDAWQSDERTHLVFVPTTGGNMGMVLIAGVEDFSGLSDALAESDIAMGAPDEEDKAVHPLTLANGKRMVLVDLGDGRAAVAEEAAHVRKALADESWLKSFPSDADVTVQFAFNPDRKSMLDEVSRQLRREADKTLEALVNAGVKPEAAKGMYAAAEKYMPLAVREFDLIQEALVEIRIADGRLLMDYGGRFGEGAVLGEIADSLSKGKNASSPLENTIPDSAVSYSVTAPLEVILPGAGARLTALYKDVYGMILPEFTERIGKTSEEFFAAGPGTILMSNYQYGMDQISLMTMEAKDPAAIVRTMRNGTALFNDMWAATFAKPELGLRFAISGPEDGSYIVMVPEFADKEKLLQQFKDSDAGVIRLQINLVEKMKFFAAVRESLVVFAVGNLDDAEFLALADTAAKKADDPMADRAAAKQLRSDLEHSQATIGFLDADGIFMQFVAQMAMESAAEFGPPAMALLGQAAEKMPDRLQKRGDMLGLSLGGVDGWLLARAVVPSQAINAIVLDYAAFERLRLELATPAEDEDEEGDPDEEDEDGSEEEEADAA